MASSRSLSGVEGDTIDSKEIMERLNIKRCALSKLRHEPFSTMPLPLNDDKKYHLYDREKMLEWIERYLSQPKGDPQPHLDNKMAQDFIRKPALLFVLDD